MHFASARSGILFCTLPCACGHRPVMIEPRDGVQTGWVQRAPGKTKLWAARRANVGVCITGFFAYGIVSARCWSVQRKRTFGWRGRLLNAVRTDGAAFGVAA